ncbi:hypothetical protein AVEN_71266-1 [Araneus ventricosus]|uniref:RNase H type-1 domain-containing protein n=1 Tax=Araneus ventricosus TaxID=182803 RepID=A0A4Y2NPZ8_ARAVE|nr:hypothetical protein AVEN_263991-1 [Araneus ventricosus]GBN41012.1 hypothetical protein AVEN_71266-1 [Araneus ventricosus]
MRPEMVKEIYLSTLERIILYGVEIWHRDRVKMNTKLLQIQRYPLLSITKAYRTTSNEALQILSGCVPIDLKAQMIVETDFKSRGVESNDNIYLIDFEIEEKIKPWEISRISWDYFANMCNGYSVFTDGSKMNGRVGSAFVLYFGGDEIDSFTYRLSDNSSVFMAEVYAINILRNLEYGDLITDSRSALMALDSLNEKRAYVNRIKRKIANYSGKVNLKWVRAHKGTKGNERADYLAKSAIEKQEIDCLFHETRTKIRLKSKQDMIKSWQNRWDSSKNGRATREFFKKVCVRRVKGDFYLNQIYTGHGVFRTHQHRFFGKTNVCHFGDEIGDMQHVLLECRL